MTHARHVKATGDPADLRAVRVREAHTRLYRRLNEHMDGHPRMGLHELVADCQRECLEALEEAEQARERTERQARTR